MNGNLQKWAYIVAIIGPFLSVIANLIDKWGVITNSVGSGMLTNFSYGVLIIAVMVAGFLLVLSISKSQNKTKIRLIQEPSSEKCYMVKGKKISHIPDPPTFLYLGSYLGFSWNDVEIILQDEIDRKFTIGAPLPSILKYFPQG